MRHSLVAGVSSLALCFVISTVAWAGKLNAADYPLRVHIWGLNDQTSHYYYGSFNRADGEGRANLYQNGDPLGFDFSYQCGERLHGTPGYETLMARWKKPGSELEILLPVYGKPDARDACDLKVVMKDGMAYYRHNGQMGEEPASVFKRWMVKHQYDPEHGLNQPVRDPQEPPAESPAASPAQPQQ